MYVVTISKIISLTDKKPLIGAWFFRSQ